MSDTIFKSKRGRFKFTGNHFRILVGAVSLLLVGGAADQLILSPLQTHNERTLDLAQSTIQQVESNHTAYAHAYQELADEILALRALLVPPGEHEHIYGEWSEPVQIAGDYVVPQFYQHRECRVENCGVSDLRNVN